MATAGLIVIGDEILSGKVVDTNTPFLIGELRELGTRLGEIAVIADQRAGIAETVARFAARYDAVFTSGGVGPTHDDVTIAGVAQAFGVGVARHPELAALLTNYYRSLPRKATTAAAEAEAQAAAHEELLARNLRMADVPEGTTLLAGADLKWPVLCVRNVYILPGIPEIFRRKFLAIRERFRDSPFFLRQIFIVCEEGEIAHHLDGIAASYPDVALGSYPRLEAAADGHRVRLTLEGKDQARVAQASDALALRLGPARIVSRG